jgi:2-(1,2-epoxy-1,2-dihydrophenyl)acetyl-CoA isomerase
MLLSDLKDGVLTLTLNRPERMNALTVKLQRELHRALTDAARDPGVHVVVLAGSGKAFCAGYDLRDGMEGETEDPVAKAWSKEPIWLEVEQVAGRLRHDAEIPLMLHTMPKPTICMVNGAAAGSGLVLAAACDLRVAAETAVFKTAFITAGRCGDPGGSYFLTRLIGSTMTREMYMLDEKIDATTAQQIGLVNRVVPAQDLLAATSALARKLASGPRLAYVHMKRNLNAALNSTLEEMLTQEAFSNARVSLSADAKEAAAAFLEKRAPKFRGY